MKRIPYILLGIVLLLGAMPLYVHAEAELVSDTIRIERAQVLHATQTESSTVPGTDTPSKMQTITAQVLDGPDKGQIATFQNDFTQLETGDVFFIRHMITSSGLEYWTVSDAYRINILVGLAVVFLALLLVFGGLQGVRGLASLLGSLVLIFYVLLPGILGGYSPILVSIGVASLIIILGSYITHGFNRTTSSAVLGMLITVVATGAATYWVIHTGNFSGFTTEENVYLNLSTKGSINMLGLLFGGIMIGLLGVLYDIAIGQAIAVEELFRAGKDMTRAEVYKRAIRIGREHIGALVNTLAIAYVGVALPLLLLLKETYSSSANVLSMLNSELFATEIVRILISSTGLILAVPITTLVASFILERHRETLGSTESHHRH